MVMKKKSLLIALVLLASVAAVLCFGCSEEGGSAESAGDLAGAPAMQPANHDGRFESLGANGCFGCHGSGELANPNLTKATEMPAFHYVDGNADSKQYSPDYAQCISCHPVGA